jgi:hypothetical protein
MHVLLAFFVPEYTRSEYFVKLQQLAARRSQSLKPIKKSYFRCRSFPDSSAATSVTITYVMADEKNKRPVSLLTDGLYSLISEY